MSKICRPLVILCKRPRSFGYTYSSRLLYHLIASSNAATKGTANSHEIMKRYKSSSLPAKPCLDDDSTMSSSPKGFIFRVADSDREFVEMTVENFEELYKNDKTGLKKDKIETVLKEYEHEKYNSLGRVPTSLNLEDMERLIIEANSPFKRRRFFGYLFKREMSRLSNANKKEQASKSRAAEVKERYKKFDEMSIPRHGLCDPSGDIIYGLWHNSLFCRIPENRLRHTTSESKLMTAALYGKKIIFDFDYTSYMNPYGLRSSLEQVRDAYGLNRHGGYQEALDMWFCNLDVDSEAGLFLKTKCIPKLGAPLVSVTEDCFTNHFDKRQLVYLTPDSRECLTDIFNDDIYIIGVYNDKGTVQQPISYRKAESLGIRCRSLPLDHYLAWGLGTKSLCINHAFGILLHCWNTNGNWREAFQTYVPSRKIKPLEVVLKEEEVRRKRSKRKFNIREDLEF